MCYFTWQNFKTGACRGLLTSYTQAFDYMGVTEADEDQQVRNLFYTKEGLYFLRLITT